MKESAIHVTTQGNVLSLSILDHQVLSYSPDNKQAFPLDGELFDVAAEYGFPGFLWLNRSFFQRFRIEREPGTKSQMKNLAKALFFANDENTASRGKKHVCLVQYLHPSGASGEHYHSIEEYILQVAGRCVVRLRHKDMLQEDQLVQMSPGRVLRIQPSYVHVLKTNADEGSMTVPIKQLRKVSWFSVNRNFGCVVTGVRSWVITLCELGPWERRRGPPFPPVERLYRPPAKVRIQLLLGTGSKARENRRIPCPVFPSPVSRLHLCPTPTKSSIIERKGKEPDRRTGHFGVGGFGLGS